MSEDEAYEYVKGTFKEEGIIPFDKHEIEVIKVGVLRQSPLAQGLAVIGRQYDDSASYEVVIFQGLEETAELSVGVGDSGIIQTDDIR